VVHHLQKEDEGIIQRLLHQLFWREKIDTRGWAITILSQRNYIGSSIKVEGSEDCIGFISVIDIHRNENKKFILEFKQYLLKNCCDNIIKKIIHRLFGNKNKGLGLILNERVLNSPPQIAPHLLSILHEEISSLEKKGFWI
jgi:protein BCP1